METVPAAASRDRLSDLPDCLLHSVLSSLRSRQAVQTCLLSRRWRNLWRSVPCLDVDQRDFPLDGDPEPPAYGAPKAHWHAYNKAHKVSLAKRRRSFEDFADAVLAVNGVFPLDACRLHVVDDDLPKELHRWIRRSLARQPAELRVAYDGISLPDDLFFSLGVASGGANALSITSRLRILHLSGLTVSEKLAEEIRSECPVLEELNLVECEYDYEHNFQGRIASRSLKRLHIQGSYRSYSSSWGLFTVSVPALVSLNLDNVDLPDIEGDLKSLAVASITYPDKGREYYILKSMRNARVLKLRSFTRAGLLENEPDSFREFHNLRTLILIECDIGPRCQVLRYVLENVSYLERLVLQDCKTYGFWREESASSLCGTTTFHGGKSLKSIQVKYKFHDVPHVLIVVLTQIAKDVLKTQYGKRNYDGWLDWMRRVVGWQKQFVAEDFESDNSLSDEEHEFHVRKHYARKNHARDCAVKAHRRAAHLARR